MEGGAVRPDCELYGGCDIGLQPKGTCCFCEWEGIGPYSPDNRKGVAPANDPASADHTSRDAKAKG